MSYDRFEVCDRRDWRGRGRQMKTLEWLCVFLFVLGLWLIGQANAVPASRDWVEKLMWLALGIGCFVFMALVVNGPISALKALRYAELDRDYYRELCKATLSEAQQMELVRHDQEALARPGRVTGTTDEW